MASKEKSEGNDGKLRLVQSTIKACVISNPDGVAEDALNNEFRQLMGTSIPWKELGFRSLSDLLATSTDIKVVESRGRRMVVANNDKSDHLSSLISGQKKTASRKKRAIRVSGPGRYGSVRAGRGGSREPSFRPSNGYSHSSNSSKSYSMPLPREAPPPIRSKTTAPAANVKKAMEVPSYYGPLPREAPPPVRDRPAPSRPTPPPLLATPRHAVPPLLPPREAPPVRKQSPVGEVPPLNPGPPARSQAAKNTSYQEKSPESKALVSKSPESHASTAMKQSGDQMNETAVTSQTSTIFINPAQKRLEAIRLCKLKSKRGRGRGVAHAAVRDTGPAPQGSFHQAFVSFALTNSWPAPEYTVLPRTSEERSIIYAATVTGTYYLDLNQVVPLGYDFSTIPDEFDNPTEAKEEVSRRAFTALSEKVKNATAPMLTTYNVNLMAERIFELVSGCPNGFWAYKVETDYKDKYGECLPPDWVNCLSGCENLCAEKYNDMYIISPRLESPTGTASPILFSQLPELEFPSTEDWDVYVTLVLSSKDVWFRFIGPSYTERLMKMSESMASYYKDWESLVCDSLVLDGLYIHPIPMASRVRLVSINSATEATVFMIDHGEHSTVKRNQLCYLAPEFALLPPQAVEASLEGLGEYEGDLLVKFLLKDKLEGKGLVSKGPHSDPHQTLPSLDLFDTSYQEPVNVNQLVKSLSTVKMFDPPPSITDGSKVIWEVCVTSVWKTTDVYIQIQNEGLSYLEHELSDLDVPDDVYLMGEEDLELDVLYLYSSPDALYRASLLRPVKVIDNKVEILLVDTGELVSSEVTRLAVLQDVSIVLSKIPKQAMLVKMSGLGGSLWEADRLREIVPVGSVVMAKPVMMEPGDVPSVELFIREPITRVLISVNTTIMAETLDQPDPIIDAIDSIDNLHITMNGGSTSPELPLSAGKLRLTKTPDISDYFNVYVICVSNPSNFTVIPHKYLKSLISLQNTLTDFYQALGPGSHRLSEFYPGQPCAVLHTDHTWNRGIVERVLAPGDMQQLCVRFCDFGNLTFVSADCIRSLNPQFLLMPALGITASLAGIRPQYQDWSVDDISRVQDLLLEKELLTIIREKNADESVVLQVFTSLYPDVSSPDYDVSSIFVSEGRAVFT